MIEWNKIVKITVGIVISKLFANARKKLVISMAVTKFCNEKLSGSAKMLF